MKEKLSLLEVCKLPDVQLHSKTAFFKSIVGRQSNQAIQMKDQIVGLSYTVKTIGVQGEQVGIMSKRVPLKLKKKEDYPRHEDYLPANNFLPHKSFFAHPLIAVKMPKEEKQEANPANPFNIMINSKKTIEIVDDKSSDNFKSTRLKVRSKSMAHMRILNQRKPQQNIEEIGKIETRKRVPSAMRKKSYSSMLKQCNLNTKQEINPLLHEENPLFKKIKRIKQTFPQFCEQVEKIVRYQIQSRNSYSSSSNLIRQYRQQL